MSRILNFTLEEKKKLLDAMENRRPKTYLNSYNNFIAYYDDSRIGEFKVTIIDEDTLTFYFFEIEKGYSLERPKQTWFQKIFSKQKIDEIDSQIFEYMLKLEKTYKEYCQEILDRRQQAFKDKLFKR